MKKYFCFLLFTLVTTLVFSQPVIELRNDTIYVDVMGDDDAQGYAYVVNRTNQTQEYHWKYDIICAPDNWWFWLDDNTVNMPPGVDTSGVKDFPVRIEPDEELYLKMQTRPFEVIGGAQVDIKLYLTQFPDSVAVRAIFIFNEGCQTVGVNNSSTENQFEVFPNPAQNHLSVNFPSNFNRELKWHLFTLTGEKVKTETINQFTQSIDLQSMASGIYFYQIIENGHVVQSDKLIVLK